MKERASGVWLSGLTAIYVGLRRDAIVCPASRACGGFAGVAPPAPSPSMRRAVRHDNHSWCRVGALQGRVSSHLACLRQCGYVTNARDGQRVIYRINDPRVRTIVEWGRQMVADNAEAIAACTRV